MEYKNIQIYLGFKSLRKKDARLEVLDELKTMYKEKGTKLPLKMKYRRMSVGFEDKNCSGHIGARKRLHITIDAKGINGAEEANNLCNEIITRMNKVKPKYGNIVSHCLVEAHLTEDFAVNKFVPTAGLSSLEKSIKYKLIPKGIILTSEEGLFLSLYASDKKVIVSAMDYANYQDIVPKDAVKSLFDKVSKDLSRLEGRLG